MLRKTPQDQILSHHWGPVKGFRALFSPILLSLPPFTPKTPLAHLSYYTLCWSLAAAFPLAAFTAFA